MLLAAVRRVFSGVAVPLELLMFWLLLFGFFSGDADALRCMRRSASELCRRNRRSDARGTCWVEEGDWPSGMLNEDGAGSLLLGLRRAAGCNARGLLSPGVISNPSRVLILFANVSKSDMSVLSR